MQCGCHQLLQKKARICQIGEAKEPERTRGSQDFPGLTQQRSLKLSL